MSERTNKIADEDRERAEMKAIAEMEAAAEATAAAEAAETPQVAPEPQEDAEIPADGSTAALTAAERDAHKRATDTTVNWDDYPLN